MKRRIICTVATAALFCAGTAWAQGQGTQSGAAGGQGGAAGAQAGQQQGAGGGTQGTQGQDGQQGGQPEEHADQNKPLTPEKMLNKLHHNNQKEIKMGQLAQEKGQSDAVKQYGQQLVTDHQAADQQVQQLAQQHSVQLKDMPKHDAAKDQAQQGQADAQANETPADHRERRRGEGRQTDKEQDHHKHLQGLSGEEFDRAFAEMMVQDHQKAIALVDRGLQQQDLEPLHALLNQVRPKLEQHLQQAQRIAQSEGPAEQNQQQGGGNTGNEGGAGGGAGTSGGGASGAGAGGGAGTSGGGASGAGAGGGAGTSGGAASGTGAGGGTSGNTR